MKLTKHTKSDAKTRKEIRKAAKTKTTWNHDKRKADDTDSEDLNDVETPKVVVRPWIDDDADYEGPGDGDYYHCNSWDSFY